MKKKLLFLAGLALVTISSAGVADAQAPTTPNPKAVVNCERVVLKQEVGGQNGNQTGSAKDPKQLETSNTNCDHYWQDQGAIGNP
jgi:hypothetical protein